MDDVILLAADFPTASRADWMALVDKTLKGGDFDRRLVARTADGIALQPLYAPEAAAPCLSARAAPAADAHRPWDLRARVDHPDPVRANRDLLHELENGAASVLLSLDPTGRRGVAATDAEGLARVLDGALLDLASVALDAGWSGPHAADALAGLAKAAPQAPLAFHLDPLSAFAGQGASPGPIESHIVAAAGAAARHAPTFAKATLFLASGRVMHEAGGSEGQELGFAAAAALAYAKAQVRAGMSMDDAFGRMVLGLCADGEYFTSIAKLRAARAIWARLTAACGVDAPAVIEARSSRRMLSRLDPWVNLLRLTAAGFGAGIGGADAVVLDPFTQPLADDGASRPTPFARRQARNTQLVLMEEAALGRVADPAGGSWFVERLTDQLARAGWAFLQAIEQRGGIVAALTSGWIAEQVAPARIAREADISRRKSGLIGVSEYPNLAEGAVEVEPVDPAPFSVAPSRPLPGPAGRCPALPGWRAAEPFEALRARAAAASPPPRAWLATLGPVADHAARVGFARNLLAAGGIEAVDSPAGEAAPEGARLTVLCGSDPAYAEQAAETLTALKAAGAGPVWLAGRPGELEPALTAAGLDGALYAGVNAVQALDRLLTEAGA